MASSLNKTVYNQYNSARFYDLGQELVSDSAVVRCMAKYYLYIWQ